MENKYIKAFTFIEILVVATIISLLAAIGSVTYAQFSKQSRDAKRKADIETVRSAIEMYRSNNGEYPNAADGNEIDFSTCTPGSIADATPATYLSKIPNDPKCTTNIYYYNSDDGSTYSIAAKLESSSVAGCAGANTCGAGINCNYCVGPYGQTN